MANPIMQMLNLKPPMQMPQQMMSLLQVMKTGGNPEQMFNYLCKQYPEANMLFKAKDIKPTPQGMEQLCRQLCQQKGINFEQALAQAQEIAKNNNLL